MKKKIIPIAIFIGILLINFIAEMYIIQSEQQGLIYVLKDSIIRVIQLLFFSFIFEGIFYFITKKISLLRISWLSLIIFTLILLSKIF